MTGNLPAGAEFDPSAPFNLVPITKKVIMILEATITLELEKDYAYDEEYVNEAFTECALDDDSYFEMTDITII